MHPLLEHLSIFTWMDVLDTKEKCVSFLGDLELIPKKTDYAPECPKCSSSMSAIRAKLVAGWRWQCKNRRDKNNVCTGCVNPLNDTFFQGLRIPITDVLALIFGYILKMKTVEIKDHLDCWRSRRNETPISLGTILDYYKQLDEIILICLKQRGETVKTKDEKNREELLTKYIKTLKSKPIYRNILFQFLMDIKSRYPCFKRKDIPQNIYSTTVPANSTTESIISTTTLVNTSAALANSAAASANSSATSTTKIFPAEAPLHLKSVSSSNSDPSISVSSDNDVNKNVENSKVLGSIPVTTSTPSINTVSDKNSKFACSEPVSKTRSTKYVTCKHSKTSRSISVSSQVHCQNTNVCKQLKSARNKTSSSSSLNIGSKSVPVSCHTSTEKTSADKHSNSLSRESASITEEVDLIRNELDIKVQNTVSLNPAASSDVRNILNENSNSSYICCDSFTFVEDMDIDHVETVNTIPNE